MTSQSGPSADSASRRHGPTRRGLLTATGVASLTPLMPLTQVSAARAASARSPRAKTLVATDSPSPIVVPGALDRRILSRFGTGINRRMIAQLNRLGDGVSWFEEQLTPGKVPDAFADSLLDWFPLLKQSPAQAWASFAAGRLPSVDVTEDFARWTLMRRIFSNRVVHEMMTDFWSNLLHVPNPIDKAWPVRFDYDNLIRANALGRFDDLLAAAVLHPAMLCYLDAYMSTSADMNENLGRELLELHTVGQSGTLFKQPDVTDSARILTGWTVDRGKTWQAYYDPSNHYTGPVKVMGFTSSNSSSDGRAVTSDYLHYLAHHPSTATRIAQRLAVRFVSDTPDAGLVADVAQAFLDAGTDIKATLRALVNHPGFRSSTATKVRTPIEDYVATCRALRVQAQQPHTDLDFANLALWQVKEIGQQPFFWIRPDGFPDVGDAWTSSSRMMGSWDTHHTLASAYRPSRGVHYEPVNAWIAQLPASFTAVAQYACRRLLIDELESSTLSAICKAVDVGPNETIDQRHPFVRFNRMPLLLACLLDSTQHMTR